MIEFLEINEKKYPVRIGYYVMKSVKAETGKSLSECLKASGETEDLEVHETILYYALKMGAFAQNGKTDIPFSKEDMGFVLDLCFYDYMKLFSSDKFFPKEKIKELEQDAEKKLQRTGASPKKKEGNKQKT